MDDFLSLIIGYDIMFSEMSTHNEECIDYKMSKRKYEKNPQIHNVETKTNNRKNYIAKMLHVPLNMRKCPFLHWCPGNVSDIGVI